MRKVSLLDTTLREGGQAPGEAFTVRQKLVIARSLDFLGIDAIEVGQPGVSRDTDEFIAEVAGERLTAELIVRAKAGERDIEAALATGIGKIAIFPETGDLRLDRRQPAGLYRAARRVFRSVSKAAESGRKVRLSLEDATRINMNVLIDLCLAALEAGADSVSLHDSAGIAFPDELRSLFLCVRSRFPGLELEALCHNDLGLAVANAVAALEGGADCLHVSVNPPGRRAGITPLCNLSATLRARYGINTVDMRSLDEISRMISRFSGAPLPASFSGLAAGRAN